MTSYLRNWSQNFGKLSILKKIRSLAEMAPVVPKWAEFGQNQKYQKIRKTELGQVTKFQRATPNRLGVIKNSP